MSRLTRSLSGISLSAFGSSAALTSELTDADAVLRMPLPLSRRLGFVSLRGGSGTSSTASYVASLLATRRAGMILGANASAGETNLIWHAGLAAPAEQRPSDRRMRARSADDARDGLPRTRSGLYTLDLRDRAAPQVAASSEQWFQELSPITRFFEVVATDWGSRSWRVDLGQVASASHVVCVVARADRYAAEEAASLVPALREYEDQPRVVLALVDVGGTASRSIETLRDSLGIPVVGIPYDASRGSLSPVGSATLAARTRIAYTRLATALMTESQLSADRRTTPDPEFPAELSGVAK
jgi:MinD-like ATPase involved in chromosome partitioning or flagellar assembly